MIMDNLTIRIYPDPSYQKLIDNHVYRYYPITGEAVKIPEEYELYEEIVMSLKNSNLCEEPSYVVEINGTFYRYYYNIEEFSDILDSPLPEKCSSRTATWFELPEDIRHAYVFDKDNNVSVKDRYILVYGKEKGEALLEHDLWIESHIVYNKEMTFFIEEEIGRFNEVKLLDSGYFSSANADLDKTKFFYFILDNRWFITIIERHDPFEDIEEELMSYTPKDFQSCLMLNKINQIKELFPGILLNIFDLSE